MEVLDLKKAIKIYKGEFPVKGNEKIVLYCIDQKKEEVYPSFKDFRKELLQVITNHLNKKDFKKLVEVGSGAVIITGSLLGTLGLLYALKASRGKGDILGMVGKLLPKIGGIYKGLKEIGNLKKSRGKQVDMERRIILIVIGKESKKAIFGYLSLKRRFVQG